MKKDKIVIIGLGYVGLPLAIRFSKYYKVIGFDNETDKIKEFKSKNFKNSQVEGIQKKNLKKYIFTFNEIDILNANYYVVTVPTPVNQALKPDLSHLIEASKISWQSIK